MGINIADGERQNNSFPSSPRQADIVVTLQQGIGAMSAHLFPSSGLSRTSRAVASPVRPHPLARSTSLIDAIRDMTRVITSRRLLGQLDDRMLSDIGISRSEALEEAARMPWDTAPRHPL
ncbi:DUF1127 domain-containing protein [Roseomonas elaeocarpi]|uniref:DUF1127 domain-containing protein n=1 Tax=Roseomonas elaeocarpi TaxID=907779 RepID=A0ABV6JUS4_9PROT